VEWIHTDQPIEWPPLDNFNEEVREQLQGLPVPSTIICACSGGADSIFLADCLSRWVKEEGHRLIVAHFNHGMRGAESDADAAFVQSWAEHQGSGVQFALGRAEGGLVEQEAEMRAARYKWLMEVYEKEGAAALCLGHHADDLMEWQLMSLFGGASPQTLASPMPVKRFADGSLRLRPLLEWQKCDIVEELEEWGLGWREDATNKAPLTPRNRIRNEIVPQLIDILGRDPVRGALRTRELMAEHLAALDGVIDQRGFKDRGPAALDCLYLKGLPRAIMRRAVMRWWMRYHSEHPLGRPVMDALLDILTGAGGSGSISVRPNIRLEVECWLIEWMESGA
jgi:tRNA(Ile)-lysidine synthase